MAVGERVSVVAAADYEEYWTLRLNGQGCLMCSPTNNTSTTVKKRLFSATVSAVILLRDRLTTAGFLVPCSIVRYKPAQLWVTKGDTGALVCNLP